MGNGVVAGAPGEGGWRRRLGRGGLREVGAGGEWTGRRAILEDGDDAEGVAGSELRRGMVEWMVCMAALGYFDSVVVMKDLKDEAVGI